MSESPEATTPSDDIRPFKAHHSMAQRAMLVLNIVVILACFAGAVALFYGKHVRESFVAAPRPTFDTATTKPAAAVEAPNGTDGATPSTVGGTGGPPETFPTPDPTAENFLITGDDNNACVDPNSPWAGAVEGRSNIGNRSDTIMVLRIDPSTKAAAVLSFPRDLWVKIPGRGSQRINTTFQRGRYDLMAQTLDQNFGVKVDHFVQIDFCAFKTIVDAVGGVAVPLSNPIRDANTGINILDVSTCHEFHGDEALAYVRSRHLQYQDSDGTWKSDGSSDYGRISRQQDFLRRMLQAANSKGLFSPSVVRGLISAVQKYIVFDQGFSIDDMLSFAGLLREIPPASLKTYQVQATGTTISGNAVLIPQINGANMRAILDIFRGTAALAAAPDQVADTTSTPAPTTAPASTTPAVTTTTAGAGPIASTTTAPATTSTTVAATAASTTTSAAPAATTTPSTNPADITHGIIPDKNATC